MGFILSIIDLALGLFLLTLIGRLILSWVQVLAKEWRPRGPLLVAAEGIYTVTDPPLKAVRKVVPNLNLGGVQLDLSFILIFFAISIARGVLRSVA